MIRRLPAAGLPLAIVAVLLPLAAGCAGGRGGGAQGERGRGEPPTASAEWAGLRFEVSVPASPRDRLRIRATVTNVTAGVREAELPWCLARARLYREGRLAFDEAAAGGCGGAVRVVQLGPGESEGVRRTLTADEVLGDSLRPGPFEVRARIPRQTGRGPPRAAMDLRLGTVVLEGPPAATSRDTAAAGS